MATATVEAESSINQSVPELRSLRRQAKFTNVMMSIGIGLMAAFTNHELVGPATYFAIIACVVCLTMR